jgi:hypothetical protein
MILWSFPRLQGWRSVQRWGRGVALLAIPLCLWAAHDARGETVKAKKKQIIGATAEITEVGSGFTFPARIDTGAKSCSLHVEKIEIPDESPKRLHNVGKPIRFLITNEDGESQWIDSRIAAAVKIRTATTNRFDRRYKVLLTLKWKDVQKEVLVTLNDRADMAYPLLIGRNFLHGDFLVDVDQDGHGE